MSALVPLSLVVAGVVHVLPVVGVAGDHERLAALYGVSVAEPGLDLLLRHRAVLFGLLGAFLLYAAAVPAARSAAFVAGVVSAGAFVVLAWGEAGLSAELVRIVRIDVAVLVALAVGGVLHWTSG